MTCRAYLLTLIKSVTLQILVVLSNKGFIELDPQYTYSVQGGNVYGIWIDPSGITYYGNEDQIYEYGSEFDNVYVSFTSTLLTRITCNHVLIASSIVLEVHVLWPVLLCIALSAHRARR